MKCNNCNSEINISDKFCKVCGHEKSNSKYINTKLLDETIIKPKLSISKASLDNKITKKQETQTNIIEKTTGKKVSEDTIVDSNEKINITRIFSEGNKQDEKSITKSDTMPILGGIKDRGVIKEVKKEKPNSQYVNPKLLADTMVMPIVEEKVSITNIPKKDTDRIESINNIKNAKNKRKKNSKKQAFIIVNCVIWIIAIGLIVNFINVSRLARNAEKDMNEFLDNSRLIDRNNIYEIELNDLEKQADKAIEDRKRNEINEVYAQMDDLERTISKTYVDYMASEYQNIKNETEFINSDFDFLLVDLKNNLEVQKYISAFSVEKNEFQDSMDEFQVNMDEGLQYSYDDYFDVYSQYSKLDNDFDELNSDFIDTVDSIYFYYMYADNNESNDFVLPSSSTRLLKKEEIEDLSPLELKIARNEIFARHGYVFTNPDLNKYFSLHSWYKEDPTVNNKNIDLSPIELENIDAISLYEQR